MQSIEIDHNSHTVEVFYSIAPSERDCGIYGGAEIEDVKLVYNGKSRSIQTTEAFDDYVREVIDNG
ncbi:hypothetical protein [Dyadobacter psychrotolerans]|uniref:Uncharacterized protein n=1 Tax=Dyadobacter psychrotolerans TaxID=2541721 RepID=A0A4R5E1A6_9BACT|nr:hypothetical protein [Dyadobacter psychrotolerans]TDE17735.1 hypothetical protein E0F88_07540 [Dyadobacter psychrotolerans]